MSIELWEELPDRFLKIRYGGWCKLEHRVRLLIFDLAGKQKFKCALCNQGRGLIIEHDHFPEIGPGGEIKTIYNIRGLVCSGCNWHLMIYEADARGDDRGWSHVDSSILSQDDFERYTYGYDCRVDDLRDQLLRERLPRRSYWRRRYVMDRLEEWEEWGADYPWYWGFDEIKDQKYGRIRTPRQYINTLTAIFRFVHEEIEKDPNFVPPDSFFQLLARVEPMMEKLRPIVEERLKVLAANNQAVPAQGWSAAAL